MPRIAAGCPKERNTAFLLDVSSDVLGHMGQVSALPSSRFATWKRTVAVLKTGRRMVKNLLSNEGSDCTNM